MASNGYLPTLVFRPEQGFNRAPKEPQHLLPIYGLRDDVILIRSSPLNMSPQQNAGPWKPISELLEDKQFAILDPTIAKPALIDFQDCCPNSARFNFKFPMSGLIEVEKDGLDLLSASDITGLPIPTMTTTDYKPYFPDIVHINSQLIYQNPESDNQKPVMDIFGDLVRRSEIIVHEDGQVSLAGTRTDMKDILSILAEFYFSKNSTSWRKSLVPHFNRLDYETSYYGSALELETVFVATAKSQEKVKLKPSKKKKGARHKTAVKQSNYIQACESLLSIIADKNRDGKSTIPMLKKSGPELPNLLTQFSASIAGIGIAVLFSVVCKVGSGRVPFCSSKLLDTGLGLGLVWLSWAVNRLRDTIVMINRNSTRKKGLKDDEMMKKLDRSLKEIYFRAATLMAVVVLTLA